MRHIESQAFVIPGFPGSSRACYFEKISYFGGEARVRGGYSDHERTALTVAGRRLGFSG